jgi:hypothetical protein
VAKSAKLSKNIVPCAIASTAVVRITLEAPGLKIVSGASGSKTVAGAKKATVFVKRCIVPAIGSLAEISSEVTQESLPHGQTF